MHYPESFRNELKDVYPDCEEIHKAVENGSPFLGRLLDDNRVSGISFEEILLLDSMEDVEKLKASVRRYQAQNALYSKWIELYNEPNPFD